MQPFFSNIVAIIGQNMTGWCEVALDHPKAGDVVELEFFEVLDSNGNVYTENLRGIHQILRYTCRGDAREVYRPWFSFQGFQYAKIVSFPGEPALQNFTACVVHSTMEQTASFSCSNPLLNQLQHNILWGMKGNFQDTPTDCPQRDERLGWTGKDPACARGKCRSCTLSRPRRGDYTGFPAALFCRRRHFDCADADGACLGPRIPPRAGAFSRADGRRLKALVGENGGHLTTGFLGTPYLLHALSENGGLREAYALLLKEDFPCWIYQVKAGATTIWEQWDGLLFSPGEQGFTAESGSGSYCVQYRLKTSDFLAQISKAW